jgi:hypothetical protein
MHCWSSSASIGAGGDKVIRGLGREKGQEEKGPSKKKERELETLQ